VHGHDLVLGAAGDLLGHDHVGRQHDLDALALGQGEDALRLLDQVALEQALADAVALGDEEGVGHAAADEQRVDLRQQVLEHGQLARHLGAADDRRERPGRRLEQLREGLISRSISRPA
jgi:hypothetical protein